MKKKNLVCKWGMAGVGCIVAANVASAATVLYTYSGETGGGVVMGINTPDYDGNALVGQFIMTTSNPNFQGTLMTYCTDVGVILSSPYNYTLTPLSSANGVNPAWISGGIQSVANLWYNDKGAATTAVQTAGLQLAIWELLYNNITGTVSASNFSSHSNNGFYITSNDANTVAAETYAASLLNNMGSLTPEQNVDWLAPTESNGSIGGSQGLLYQVPGQVPETASTLDLLGVAVTALGIAARRYRKA